MCELFVACDSSMVLQKRLEKHQGFGNCGEHRLLDLIGSLYSVLDAG